MKTIIMETPTTTPAELPAEQEELAACAASEPAVAWQAHPARERPAQAALGLGIILVVAALIYITAASAGFALLGAVLLFGALNRFYFPSKFEIDELGITAHYPLRRVRYRWTQVQRFVWDEFGGYLSKQAKPSRLDAWRGMHLLFDEADRQRIIQSIQHALKAR